MAYIYTGYQIWEQAYNFPNIKVTVYSYLEIIQTRVKE